ncbi:hypothetical protein IT400_02230 [Candidatus Nomurabacteria bacterium]|nr:hypothetical protein [Candidatus Nomurabacteria bacterium]
MKKNINRKYIINNNQYDTEVFGLPISNGMDTNNITKTSKFVRVSIVVAIVVVMNMFFNYGVSLVYKEPVYDQFIKPAPVIESIKTRDECLSIGGQWNENIYPEKLSETKATGYCDPNYTNQKNYDEARKLYERNVFITLVVLGVVSLIIAGFLTLPLLSISFAWGGVLSFIIASIRYWSIADNLLKVVILGIALATLIYLAVKKFSK